MLEHVPFNISGKYKLFDKPVDEIDDAFDDDEAVESDVEFEATATSGNRQEPVASENW